MEELLGCWRETRRADAVATKLLRIRQLSESVDLEFYQPLTILLKEIESSARELRDLCDLFPIYRSMPIVVYNLTVVLPSLQKTLTDMMIYIDNELFLPLKQWTTMCQQLDGQGGMTLVEWFAMYNEFFVRNVRLLSRSATCGCNWNIANFPRSPLYDPANLEYLRIRVLRIRTMQGIPGKFYTRGEGLHGKGAKCLQIAPPIPVMPHQPGPAGTPGAAATAAQPSASKRSPVELANADQRHWAEKIFGSMPHSATGLNHLRESAITILPET